jgi:hypothetical protein
MVMPYKYYVPAESRIVTWGGPAYPWGGAGESLAIGGNQESGVGDVIYDGVNCRPPFRWGAGSENR